MRRALLLLALCLSACPPAPAPDAGSGEACLDRPSELTRAPHGQLPCELLPPGFKR